MDTQEKLELVNDLFPVQTVFPEQSLSELDPLVELINNKRFSM